MPGLHISCPPNHDKKKCTYCKKLMFLDDPITVCSDCRSVYHRSCWTDIGSDCVSDECQGLVAPEETTTAVGQPAAGTVAPVVPGVAGGTMAKFMALVRQEHVVLWAAVVCTAIGFCLLEASLVTSAGAGLAGLVLALLVWMESAVSEDGVPLSEAGKRLLKAVLVGCTALVFTSVLGGLIVLVRVVLARG